MCANYTPTRNERWLMERLGVQLPAEHLAPETWPGLGAPLVCLDDTRRAPVCRAARFGLIPHWAKDDSFSRRTYNARSETVAEKPSYRGAWRQRRLAIAVAEHFFEPNWETGRAVRWRIARTDGAPMGIASLWDRWTDPSTGEVVHSFSMLTVNADGHPVMGRFHRPGDEKRSVVILPPEQFQDWLYATPASALQLCRPPAPELLVTQADPRP